MKSMIKDLETMEKIVNDNKDLSWDGWDVIEVKPSPSAMFKTNGAFINGKWHIRNVFKYGSKGWEIPGKYVR